MIHCTCIGHTPGSCNGGIDDTDLVYTIDRHTGGGCDCLSDVFFDTQEQSH